jgi:ribosomal-protein-alanine N-acetyltransferase
MTLRFATAAEAPLLAALHATAFPPGEAWDAGAFATLLAMEGVFGLAAQGGVLLARIAGGEAEILTLAVTPDCRRQGLGDALVETAALHAAALGAEAMFLEVAEANAPALALYFGLGFAAAGRRPAYYGEGRDAFLLRRSLRPGLPDAPADTPPDAPPG